MGVRAPCFARRDGPGWGRVQRVSGDGARLSKLGRGPRAAARSACLRSASSARIGAQCVSRGGGGLGAGILMHCNLVSA